MGAADQIVKGLCACGLVFFFSFFFSVLASVLFCFVLQEWKGKGLLTNPTDQFRQASRLTGFMVTNFTEPGSTEVAATVQLGFSLSCSLYLSRTAHHRLPPALCVWLSQGPTRASCGSVSVYVCFYSLHTYWKVCMWRGWGVCVKESEEEKERGINWFCSLSSSIPQLGASKAGWSLGVHSLEMQSPWKILTVAPLFLLLSLQSSASPANDDQSRPSLSNAHTCVGM